MIERCIYLVDHKHQIQTIYSDHWKYEGFGNTFEPFWKKMPFTLRHHVAWVRNKLVYIYGGEYQNVGTAHRLLWGYVPDVGVVNPFTGETSV